MNETNPGFRLYHHLCCFAFVATLLTFYSGAQRSSHKLNYSLRQKEEEEEEEEEKQQLLQQQIITIIML